MDIFVNGYLIAQGEVVVVDEKYGIRVTDIITPSDRISRLTAAVDDSMTDAAVLRLLASLVFIVGLILACGWLMRRAGWLRAGNGQAIKVLSSQNLGSRAYVAMVEVDDARLVLGVTANQVSLLHTLPPSEPAMRAEPALTPKSRASPPCCAMC